MEISNIFVSFVFCFKKKKKQLRMQNMIYAVYINMLKVVYIVLLKFLIHCGMTWKIGNILKISKSDVIFPTEILKI